MEDNAIIALDGLDSRANTQHGSGGFVAQQVGQEFVRSFRRFNFIDLRTANTAVMDFDVDLTVGKRVRKLDIDDFQGFPAFNENGRFHQYSFFIRNR